MFFIRPCRLKSVLQNIREVVHRGAKVRGSIYEIITVIYHVEIASRSRFR